MADYRLKSKKWRMAHLYKIKTKDKQIVQFRRNRAQRHFAGHKWTRNIILKSRQLGITTDECVDTLDDCLFTPNFDALLIADIKENATDIFDNKVDLAWQHFPADLKRRYLVDTNKANKLKFDLGRKNYSSFAVRLSGRSGTFRRVHISELAKLSKLYPARAAEVVTGTIPSVPLDGRVDIESTAEGEQGEFYDLFMEAWGRKPQHQTEFKAHFYNWTWDDAEIAKVKRVIKNLPADFRDYQKLHRLDDIQISYLYLKYLSLNKDWERLMQEYPTTPEEAFVRSGSKLFDLVALAMQKPFRKKPIRRYGDWKIYYDYKPGHKYVVGGDPAEGHGGDHSAAVILDVTPLRPRVVATYKSDQIEPDRFAYELRDGAHRYGCPLIIVERNNHGHTTLAALKRIYPPEFIYEETRDDGVNVVKTGRLGFPMNNATKPRVFYALKSAFDDELIECCAAPIIKEARVYDKSNLDETARRRSAHKGTTKHFDLLTSLALAWFARNDVPDGIITGKGWKQPDYVPSSNYEGR